MLDLFFSNGAGWFTVLALSGTSIFLLRLVLLFLGHQFGDIHADTGDIGGGPHDSHTDPGAAFKALSLQSIAAFAMGFGWGGLGALKGSGLSWTPTFAIAAASGVAMVWLLALLLKGIHDLQSTGNVPITDSVGSEGDVYVTVPGNHAGSGQVRVTIGERQRIYNASTDAEPLPTGTKVRVVGINQDNTVVVIRA